MKIAICLIPLISAFIGWFPIWIAIKMLFHPKRPIKIIGITFQGFFPKRQKQIAEKGAKLISEELLFFSDIKQKIADPKNIEQLMPYLETQIDHFLRVRLASEMPMISMFIGDKTINQMKSIFIKELESLFPQIMQNYMEQLEKDLDLEKIILNKLSSFSSNTLYPVLHSTISKEFRSLQIIGGILGFLMGLLQVFLIHFS